MSLPKIGIVPDETTKCRGKKNMPQQDISYINMPDQINTPRLILRQLFLSDAKELSLYGSDYDIARMTGTYPHPFPLLSAEFKIMHMQALRRRALAYPYAITHNNGMIGIMDIFKRKPGSDFELGYWLGRPFWRQGYAAEAALAVMDEANMRGVARFVVGIFADNSASIKLIEKLGFLLTPETTLEFSMARMASVTCQHYAKQII